MSNSSSSFPLDETTVAFVTGTDSPRGVGRNLVKMLLEKGVKKVYAASTKKELLDEVVESNDGRVVAVELDVTKREQVDPLGKLYPDVNLLINNAGYNGFTNCFDEEVEKMRMEMDVNYFGPLLVSKSFQHVLRKEGTTTEEGKKQSALVNVASIATFMNFPVCATYSASKAANYSLTQMLRRELPSSLVIGVFPGPIDTDMCAHLDIDKFPASVIAKSIIEALENGTEECMPDPISSQLYEDWRKDPKAVERAMTESAKQEQS